MTSWWTCADFKICGRWAFPWSSTRLTPFNCRAAPGIAPQASGSTSPRSPGRRSPSGSTRSSWRCTRIPTGRSRTGGRCPTGRTCCASAICRGSWTRSPRSPRRSRQPRGRPWNEERHEKRSRIAPRLRPPMTRPDLRRLAERVLRLEAEAILGLIPKLDESFDRAVELLRRCAGRVVVTGMGKSGLVGRKIAATLASRGTLGWRALVRVADLMLTGDAVPVVGRATPLRDVIVEMTQKKKGVTTVVDDAGRLAGVITDGDLRRLHLRRTPIDALSAGEVATHEPKTIRADDLAAKALEVMETWEITSLVIIDAERRPWGLVHMHDILRAKIV